MSTADMATVTAVCRLLPGASRETYSIGGSNPLPPPSGGPDEHLTPGACAVRRDELAAGYPCLHDECRVSRPDTTGAGVAVSRYRQPGRRSPHFPSECRPHRLLTRGFKSVKLPVSGDSLFGDV